MTVYADLVRYRELFSNLFRRDFQAKYKGSALGVLWSLLNPLILLGVYLLVFGVIFPSPQIPHYALYLLAGLACWTSSRRRCSRRRARSSTRPTS